MVHTEDIIGLNIQAAFNDPTRADGDWSDIHRLVRHANRSGKELDWELIEDHLALFEQSHKLTTLKKLHGTAHHG